MATRKGKLRHALPAYTHPHVLVIDEVGYLSYGPDAANVLFHVVNERYLHQRPMLFTTNKPLSAWGRVLHDRDLAEVILDREHNRHVAFGAGIHRCAGSNLARLELRVALQVWLERIPRFRLADPDDVTWAGGQVRGPRRLRVVVG